MTVNRVKTLLVAAFSLFCLVVSGQKNEDPDKHIDNLGHEEIEEGSTKKFDANEVIFGHVLDAHQFHFFSYKGNDNKQHHVGINLPVILYSPQKGFSVFSSSKFHHGEHEHEGYQLVTEEYKK